MITHGRPSGRAGDFQFKSIQMDNVQSGGVVPYDLYTQEWYMHFSAIQNKATFDMPEPCIWKNKLGLRGGLKPVGAEFPLHGHEFVYLKSGRYVLADMGDIRPPTNVEYEKHFKKLFESKPPWIRSRLTRKGVELPDHLKQVEVVFTKVNKRGRKADGYVQ